MFEGITPLHLVVVLLIALIVLGPGKLPEVGAALGKSIREFRRAATDSESEPTTSESGESPATPPLP
jgi:sec-independent protein translocase protein TatA